MTMTTLPGDILLVDASAAITPTAMPDCRRALLDTRRRNRPAALIVKLDSMPNDDARYAICELLQYVDLCVIDRASAALLGVETPAPHPNRAAALGCKLVTRFALGGVVLPDEGYARLDSIAAQSIFPAVCSAEKIPL